MRLCSFFPRPRSPSSSMKATRRNIYLMLSIVITKNQKLPQSSNSRESSETFPLPIAISWDRGLVLQNWTPSIQI